MLPIVQTPLFKKSMDHIPLKKVPLFLDLFASERDVQSTTNLTQIQMCFLSIDFHELPILVPLISRFFKTSCNVRGPIGHANACFLVPFNRQALHCVACEI
jgi:hypothetical protein